MDEDFLKRFENEIGEKLGEENKALIADNLAELYTINKEVNDNINNIKQELNQVKSSNEKLIKSNGALLQQIPMTSDNEFSKDNEDNKEFNLRDMLNSDGTFKKEE